MSGLLRRLASQALNGGMQAIHSQARLPYAAPLEWVQHHEAAPLTANSVRPTVSRQEPAASPPLERHASQLLSTCADPADEGSVRKPAEMPARQSAIVSSTLYPVPHSLQFPEDRTPFEPADIMGHGQAEAEAIEFSRMPSPPTGSAAPLVSPSTQAGEEGAKPFSPEGGRVGGRVYAGLEKWADLNSTLLPPRLPARLLDPLHASPSTTAIRPALPRETLAQPTRVAGSEVNEVHVHIGRIEVTAVHESQAPKRAASPPRRQPMSLDEYLTKRKGGLA
jgi:hypothetical protein